MLGVGRFGCAGVLISFGGVADFIAQGVGISTFWIWSFILFQGVAALKSYFALGCFDLLSVFLLWVSGSKLCRAIGFLYKRLG